jgi:hypothetical protein
MRSDVYLCTIPAFGLVLRGVVIFLLYRPLSAQDVLNTYADPCSYLLLIFR